MSYNPVNPNGQATASNSYPVTIASDQTAIPVNIAPSASAAGLSIYRNIDLGSTGQVVKASAGKLHNYALFNQASSVRYVKVYDKATAATNSDTPVMTLALPANSGAVLSSPSGFVFASGISVRATTGVADNDTGAPTAADVIVNLGYV